MGSQNSSVDRKSHLRIAQLSRLEKLQKQHFCELAKVMTIHLSISFMNVMMAMHSRNSFIGSSRGSGLKLIPQSPTMIGVAYRITV